LGLTIGDLGDSRRSLGLTISGLAGGRSSTGSTAVKNLDVDRRALFADGLVVQVVEAARVALVPNGGATKSEGAVATNGETISVDLEQMSVSIDDMFKGLKVQTYGAGLGWAVKLELVVRSNVSGPSLRVGELAVGERDLEGLCLAGLEGALGGCGDVDGGDGEGVGHGARATFRGGGGWGEILSDTLRSGVGGGRKGEDGENSVHGE